MLQSQPSEAPETTSRSRYWLESLVVFLLLFVAAGDPAPAVNEAHYLVRLKHYWDPGWRPNDLFLESPDAHFTVVWLFGWVTRLVSLEATAWIGRLLSWGLLALGWTRLTRRLTQVPLMATLGAGLLVYGVNEWHFAGEWVVGGFEAKVVAYGLVFFALADALVGRWNRAWLLLGGASAFHALVGGWSVVALGAAWLLGPRQESFRSMLPGLVGGALLATAGVGPALALNFGASPDVVDEANQTYVFLRLPHHLAPLTKDPEWLTLRARAHLSLVAILAALTFARRSTPGVSTILRFAWAAEAISAAGLAIELVGWNDPAWAASWLKYYWFRLADVAAPSAVALAAVQGIGAAIESRRPIAGPVAGLAAVALAFIAGWHLESRVTRRLDKPVARGDAAMRDPAAWIAMCDWVAENTPDDAVFLVPRQSHTFKWRTGRGEVVTYKDVPQDAPSMVEWRRRYLDVFQIGEWPNGSRRWAPSLAALGAARLRELGAEYGATHVLDEAPRRDLSMPKRRRASLPVIHREGPYTLYLLGR